MPLPPKTWVEVSAGALRHNAAQLTQGAAPGASLMAVVKSNAYGHGLSETVAALKGRVPWYGVDSLQEAEVVRKGDRRGKILILGTTLPAWMPRTAALGARMSISSPEAAIALIRLKKRAVIHLEVETGLTRQGIGEPALPKVLQLIAKQKQVTVEGMFTHFANIEDTTEHAYAQQQLKRFKKMLRQAEHVLKGPISMPHTACSAAAILFPETHFSLVRAGISLYGYWPSKETFVSARQTKRVPVLRPALTWKTTIAQIKNVAAGTPVSYGLTERLRRNGRIAVLPIGYWDGFDRRLSRIGLVLVRGKQAKVMGRVCMNMTMIDVSHAPRAQAGESVTLLCADPGAGVDANALAEQLNTINYEILTRINPLIPRVLV